MNPKQFFNTVMIYSLVFANTHAQLCGLMKKAKEKLYGPPANFNSLSNTKEIIFGTGK
jgi:hypothetical protein